MLRRDFRVFYPVSWSIFDFKDATSTTTPRLNHCLFDVNVWIRSVWEITPECTNGFKSGWLNNGQNLKLLEPYPNYQHWIWANQTWQNRSWKSHPFPHGLYYKIILGFTGFPGVISPGKKTKTKQKQSLMNVPIDDLPIIPLPFIEDSPFEHWDFPLVHSIHLWGSLLYWYLQIWFIAAFQGHP